MSKAKLKIKTVPFNTRMPEGVKELLNNLANASGMTISEFLNRLILEKGSEVMKSSEAKSSPMNDFDDEEDAPVIPRPASEAQKDQFFEKILGQEALKALQRYNSQNEAIESFFKDTARLKKDLDQGRK